MPTPSEQKALAFVAIVILLGGAVRVLRAGSAPVPTELEQQALAHQASATDSAASRARTAKQGKHPRSIKSRDRRDTLPVVVGGVSSVPPTYARPDRPFARQPFAAGNSSTGFPPPDPRIDTDLRGQRPAEQDGAANKKASSKARAANAPPLDLDVASAADIDRLPYVGPSLAKRLVANRDSFGPFRTLEGLGRVKGVGPGTLQRLGGLVTFSARATPSRAGP
jgi:competence protein ComEA